MRRVLSALAAVRTLSSGDSAQCRLPRPEVGPLHPRRFITTTFRPELIHTGDKFYGVTHRNKASTIRSITQAEAHRIIAEDTSRARQHVGAEE